MNDDTMHQPGECTSINGVFEEIPMPNWLKMRNIPCLTVIFDTSFGTFARDGALRFSPTTHRASWL